jgi:plastocyanin domain-containing protein
MRVIGIVLILFVVGLYGLWIWYMKNRKGVSAKIKDKFQIFDIVVKGVYSPAVIEAEIGKPIKINFTRKESSDCSRFVNFPDFKIREELPENKTITIELNPSKKGEFVFTCDMSMYQGKLIVK